MHTCLAPTTIHSRRSSHLRLRHIPKARSNSYISTKGCEERTSHKVSSQWQIDGENPCSSQRVSDDVCFCRVRRFLLIHIRSPAPIVRPSRIAFCRSVVVSMSTKIHVTNWSTKEMDERKRENAKEKKPDPQRSAGEMKRCSRPHRGLLYSILP